MKEIDPTQELERTVTPSVITIVILGICDRSVSLQGWIKMQHRFSELSVLLLFRNSERQWREGLEDEAWGQLAVQLFLGKRYDRRRTKDYKHLWAQFYLSEVVNPAH